MPTMRQVRHRTHRRAVRQSLRNHDRVSRWTRLALHPVVSGGGSPSPISEDEWAYHEWPWFSITTRDVVGPTGHRLPSVRVWTSGARARPGAYRAMLRKDPCCYCGEPMLWDLLGDPTGQHPRSGTVEHVERRADAGIGLEGNIVGACKRCNQQRHEKSVLEWLLRQRTGLAIEDLMDHDADRRAA